MLFSIASVITLCFAAIGVYLSAKEFLMDCRSAAFSEYTLLRADDEESAEGLLRYTLTRYPGKDVFVHVADSQEIRKIVSTLAEKYPVIHVIEKKK